MDRPIVKFIFICYLFIQGIDLSFFGGFILIVFRRFIFQIRRPIFTKPFTFPSFLLPIEGLGGGLCDDSNSSFFNHPRRSIYFSLYVLLSLSFIFQSAIVMVHIILCWPVTVVYKSYLVLKTK